MPPKAHRGSSGQLRSHSRSSSSTKLGTNLQFTQKDLPPPKHAEKGKKNGYTYEAHPKPAPAFARVNSSQRVHSREQMQVLPVKRAPAPKSGGGKGKAGFTIASPGDEEDEDEWVSSESGAATPSHNESDSDTASEGDAIHLQLNHNLVTPQTAQPDYRVETPLPRVDTARPSQFDAAALSAGLSAAQYETRGPTLPALPPPPPLPRPVSHPDEERVTPSRSETSPMKDTHSEPPTHPHHSPRLPNKRYSVTRPPSTHSTTSRAEHLRPHPLIRGQSYGQIGKPAPLAPLTVIPQAAPPQISTSPPSSIHSNNQLSTSPSSMRTSLASPDIPSSAQDRRMSFSSARSVNTIPVHSTLLREGPKNQDRQRTISTMSSSSSAALSSLAHLPSVTRPPSPQTISFFPPVNPHLNIEGIHPLLPPPYLNNHLTVLARRTPIRESFDRVIRAKQAAR
ncbi:hypothetical protein BDQ12DRAFT_730582 [Crucibulum laeve]|uniref:Uncharacterized protein n=1 Tax=Crucibulum laeve TaxID=68775 RepID=A0A5C3MJF8_9AGAR|nr:hypothetical protein BDQ12DRAFT_730582 [Crucibulum laeve]